MSAALTAKKSVGVINGTATFYGPNQSIVFQNADVNARAVFYNPEDERYYRTLTLSITGSATDTAFPHQVATIFSRTPKGHRFLANQNEQFTLTSTSRVYLAGSRCNNFWHHGNTNCYFGKISEVLPAGTYNCFYGGTNPFPRSPISARLVCSTSPQYNVYQLIVPPTYNGFNKITLTFSNPVTIF